MMISLVGYMGSGKSHISKVLSQKLDLKLIDLDQEISLKNKISVAEIFKTKGEIYFRKEERQILHEILNSENDCILSLGGGTPAYYDNMKIINEKSTSIYLQTNIKNLTDRLLLQRGKRPLIAKIPDEDLPEFIAKHLFERQVFYGQSKYTVSTNEKNPDEIGNEIVTLLNL